MQPFSKAMVARTVSNLHDVTAYAVSTQRYTVSIDASVPSRAEGYCKAVQYSRNGCSASLQVDMEHST